MQSKSKFWFLKHINILDGMDESLVQSIDKISSMSSVGKHQPIYFGDEPSRSVYFLKDGHVKISRVSPDGKEVIIDVIGPGEIFGELSLVDEGDGRDEIAEALDDALVCAMNVQDFQKVMKNNPELNLEVTKRIGLRLRKVQKRVSDMIFKDVRQRTAGFLVEYAEEFGKIKNGVVTVNSPLTHQEIALLTGSARQTTTSILDELRKSGVIEFSRDSFTITDYEKLRKLAG